MENLQGPSERDAYLLKYAVQPIGLEERIQSTEVNRVAMDLVNGIAFAVNNIPPAEKTVIVRPNGSVEIIFDKNGRHYVYSYATVHPGKLGVSTNPSNGFSEVRLDVDPGKRHGLAYYVDGPNERVPHFTFGISGITERGDLEVSNLHGMSSSNLTQQNFNSVITQLLI